MIPKLFFPYLAHYLELLNFLRMLTLPFLGEEQAVELRDIHGKGNLFGT
jgi:hypothetical protein